MNARGTRVRAEMKRQGIIGSRSVFRYQLLLLMLLSVSVLQDTKRGQRMIGSEYGVVGGCGSLTESTQGTLKPQ